MFKQWQNLYIVACDASGIPGLDPGCKCPTATCLHASSTAEAVHVYTLVTWSMSHAPHAVGYITNRFRTRSTQQWHGTIIQREQ